MVGLAEAQMLALEKCSYAFLERKREGQRGKRERDRWGAWEEGRAASAAVRTKLSSCHLLYIHAGSLAPL